VSRVTGRLQQAIREAKDERDRLEAVAARDLPSARRRVADLEQLLTRLDAIADVLNLLVAERIVSVP
jgi:hypothetical protein